MPRFRCITEMGRGVDVHGGDATKAARRAVSDAIRHSSLGFVRMLGKTPHDMFVDVTVAVPNPEAVDVAAVAKELPYGAVTVTGVKGGLEGPAESGGDAILLAQAAGVVSFGGGEGPESVAWIERPARRKVGHTSRDNAQARKCSCAPPSSSILAKWDAENCIRGPDSAALVHPQRQNSDSKLAAAFPVDSLYCIVPHSPPL